MLFLVSLALAKVEPHHMPLSLSHDHHERMGHFECFNVVRSVERLVRGGKSVEEITKELDGHCEKVKDPRKNICVQIIPNQIGKIVDFVQEKKRPDYICDMLGYSFNFGSSRLIAKDKCMKYVDAVKSGMSEAHDRRPSLLSIDHDAKVEEMRKHALEPRDLKKLPFGLDHHHHRLERPDPNRIMDHHHILHHIRPGAHICHEIEDHEERTVCHIVVRQAMREMKPELEKETSEKICDLMNEKKLIKLTEEQVKRE